MANVCDREQVRWCSTDSSIIGYGVRKCCVHRRLSVATTTSQYLSSYKTVSPCGVRDLHWANDTSWIRCRMNLPQMSSSSEEKHLNICVENQLSHHQNFILDAIIGTLNFSDLQKKELKSKDFSSCVTPERFIWNGVKYLVYQYFRISENHGCSLFAHPDISMFFVYL